MSALHLSFPCPGKDAGAANTHSLATGLQHVVDWQGRSLLPSLLPGSIRDFAIAAGAKIGSVAVLFCLPAPYWGKICSPLLFSLGDHSEKRFVPMTAMFNPRIFYLRMFDLR